MNDYLLQRIRRLYKKVCTVADMVMMGMPDYQNYVARRRKYNPNAPVMTERQFQDYCNKRRSGSSGGRCC